MLTSPRNSIHFLISNNKNLELGTYYNVMRLYPETKTSYIAFTRETAKNGQDPLKRWLVIEF